MSTSNQNIIPKSCSYNCGTRIYWDTTSNSYLEVFTIQKHICKNRSAGNNPSYPKTNVPTTTKPTYYNKFSKQPKPKMSNSLELLQDPIQDI